MQRNFTERRQRRSSYAVPLLYFLLELVMMWLVISLLNWDLDIRQWGVYAYAGLALWLSYSSLKLTIVIKRQKRPLP
ncbi:MAG: hypothetical protein IBX43_03015 [Campylobacterales bacterium]|nr:hypothetical protein [Campylobacterales bacterium]